MKKIVGVLILLLGAPWGFSQAYLEQFHSAVTVDKQGTAWVEETISAVGNETGGATLSPNLIEQTEDKLILTADFRVPAKMRAEEFLPLFDALGVKYALIKGRDPLYVPKDSEYVQKLAAAYNAVTGENLQPISQRGATFASVFENGTAFGPEFPNEDNRIHAPDEFISDENINRMYEIYLAGLKAVIQ